MKISISLSSKKTLFLGNTNFVLHDIIDITQYPSQQMYMHTAPPIFHPMPPPPPFVSGAYPYNHPIYEEEPSCFVR